MSADIKFEIAPAYGMSKLRRGTATNAALEMCIGWLCTGEIHPSALRITGGQVVVIPKRDIQPYQVQTLIKAWRVNAHRDNIYDHHGADNPIAGSHIGWIGSVWVPVDVDGALEQILAEASLPNKHQVVQTVATPEETAERELIGGLE